MEVEKRMEHAQQRGREGKVHKRYGALKEMETGGRSEKRVAFPGITQRPPIQ